MAFLRVAGQLRQSLILQILFMQDSSESREIGVRHLTVRGASRQATLLPLDVSFLRRYLVSVVSTSVGLGNLAGTGMVTLPVATHSVPRLTIVWKPTQVMECSECPINVVKTFPLP